MRVAGPAAKRHRSGSVGSFLSMVSSDSQPSGAALSHNPLTLLARTGSRIFSGVVSDLPPLVSPLSPTDDGGATCAVDGRVLRSLAAAWAPWQREVAADNKRPFGAIL